jgi:hypothetical protein
VTAVICQAGVLALADCAREGVGGTAALDLMGGRPQDLPQRYRLADPMTAVPVEASVLCLHSRADDAVPFAYSERYVAAAARAGGRARLRETNGDHFTLIDPHSVGAAVLVAGGQRLAVRAERHRIDPRTSQVGEGGYRPGGLLNRGDGLVN